MNSGAVRSADERGLAAPVVVTLAGVLLVVAMTAGVLGRLLVDQRRVAAAADLAALAGAVAVQHGRPACEAARRNLQLNLHLDGARLVGCAVDGDRVRVEAGAEAPSLLSRVVRLRAAAYAGPVDR